MIREPDFAFYVQLKEPDPLKFSLRTKTGLCHSCVQESAGRAGVLGQSVCEQADAAPVVSLSSQGLESADSPGQQWTHSRSF